MTCETVRAQLGSALDGELPAAETAPVHDHLASCDRCRREYDALRTLQIGIRQHLAPAVAPDLLRASIVGAIRSAPSLDAPVRTRTVHWTRQFAAGLIIAVASSVTTYAVLRHPDTESRGAVSDAVADHVRSLMTGHLTDVTSTNEHNVKPWFDGKVAFAPEVPRLDSVGFPLIGGRVDTIGRTAVAALVYGRRQHLINVFTWPAIARNGAGDTVTGTTERGYNLIRWTRGDMQYAAVSDLAMEELRSFVAAYSSLPSLIPSKRTVDR